MKLSSIRLRRINLGLESNEVIELLKISKSTFYKLENGWMMPSPKLIKKLANIYQCTVDQIFKDLKLKAQDKT